MLQKAHIALNLIKLDELRVARSVERCASPFLGSVLQSIATGIADGFWSLPVQTFCTIPIFPKTIPKDVPF
jgi:hypothetical protein